MPCSMRYREQSEQPGRGLRSQAQQKSDLHEMRIKPSKRMYCFFMHRHKAPERSMRR